MSPTRLRNCMDQVENTKIAGNLFKYKYILDVLLCFLICVCCHVRENSLIWFGFSTHRCSNVEMSAILGLFYLLE